jgi:hypothetical protein
MRLVIEPWVDAFILAKAGTVKITALGDSSSFIEIEVLNGGLTVHLNNYPEYSIEGSHFKEI